MGSSWRRATKAPVSATCRGLSRTAIPPRRGWGSACPEPVGGGGGAVLVRGGRSDNAPSSSSHEWALLLGGIVGQQLPRLRPRIVDLQPGDMVLMATDGVARSFAEDAIGVAGPARLADRILEN